MFRGFLRLRCVSLSFLKFFFLYFLAALVGTFPKFHEIRSSGFSEPSLNDLTNFQNFEKFDLLVFIGNCTENCYTILNTSQNQIMQHLAYY